MNNVHTAAANLATALECRNRSVEERYQRLDLEVPIMYRARVLGASLIVEVEDYGSATGWQGVYMTDDARDAATVLYGLERFPA